MDSKSGFTLIELSIVLVIIGLIVGGVLVGQDLIRAAAVRAQISQIEKYNTAVNTFYGKYGYLPGDLNGAIASQFGFEARGSGQGEGDGNGIIEGSFNNGGSGYGITQIEGETGMFWVDLTTANGLNLNLIEGGFSAATPTFTSPFPVSGTSLALYFPSAKLGGSNYVYVWSGGVLGNDGANYYGIGIVNPFVEAGGCANFNAGMSVRQAYDIDNKVDDGLPKSGRVQTNYLLNCTVDQSTSSVSGDSTTCSDQSGSPSGPFHYSVGQNNGAGVNCALSFKFQ